ncbi:MAG TPA: autotransporter domain-containing protein [Methylophilaceae bacterium]
MSDKIQHIALNQNFAFRRKAVRIAVSAALPIMMLGAASQAQAACTASTNFLTTSCSGTVTAPIDTYDAAAAFQPTAGGNGYTPANVAFPATGYNPTPPTVIINLDSTAVFNVTATTGSGGGLNNDRGLITANYSNSEDPAVNNVTINNAGLIGLTSTSLAPGRLHAIVGDSQVNTMTVNNAATGNINATQTFNWGGTFNASNLTNTFSSSALTYTAKYSGTNLAIVSGMYSDDNTNSFVINNLGTMTATGNYAAVYYGRADTTINNSGTLQNGSWVGGDAATKGHWAIVSFAGSDFATVEGSNPDTPLYKVTDITNVTYGGGTHPQGNLVVEETSALALTNSGTIKGDIVVIDTNPMNWAAAIAASVAPSTISASGSNSGPRDSDIENSGTINGNIYLGSGEHVLNNSGAINGNISVDQGGGIGVFAVAKAGVGGMTYNSNGGTNSTGGACPTAGTGTNDPYCAATSNVLAAFAGARSFSLTNTGSAIGGNLSITNTTADSMISLSTAVIGSGAGSTKNAPSTNMAGIAGTLTISGAVPVSNIVLTPTINPGMVVKNGEWYQVANAVAGGVLTGSSLPTIMPSTGLVSWRDAINSNGNLVVGAIVQSPSNIAGISGAGANAITALLGSGSDLGSTLQNMTTADAVRKLAEQLHPEINGASIQAAMGVTTKVFGVIDTHLDETHLAQLNGRSGIATGDQPANVGVWMQGFGFRGDQDLRKSVDGYNADAYGFAMGADTPLNDSTRVGAALSYANSSIDAKGATTGNTTAIDSYQATLYGSMIIDKWYLDAALGLGRHDYTSKRIVIGNTVNGDHEAWQYTAKLDAGWPMQFGKATITPVASLAYSRLSQDSYSESGVGALNVGSQDTDSFRSGLGAKAQIPLYEHGGVNSALELRAIWSHEFADTAQDTTASFTAGGSTFTSNGVSPARDSADLGASIRIAGSDSKNIKQSLLLSYDAEVKDQYLSHTAQLQARFDF